MDEVTQYKNAARYWREIAMDTMNEVEQLRKAVDRLRHACSNMQEAADNWEKRYHEANQTAKS